MADTAEKSKTPAKRGRSARKTKTSATKKRTSTSGRGKRSKTNSSEAPTNVSSSMYVGYVEENESIEMIMKKFEKLEELKERKKQESTGDVNNDTAGQNDLTEKDMEQLFKETSTFRLESVLKEQPEDYFGSDEEFLFDDDDEEDGWDMYGVQTRKGKSGEKFYVFSDDDDLWGQLFDGKKTTKKKASRKKSGKKGKSVNYTVVPTGPLPESWGRTIAQYVPEEAIHTKTFWKPGEITNMEIARVSTVPKESELIDVKSVLTVNLEELAKKKTKGFEGIIISPPWKERFGSENPSVNTNAIVPADLLKLNLGNVKILQAGFIYIWTPKHWAVEILETMRKMNFFYVENAVVVRERTNHKLPTTKASGENRVYKGVVFNHSHETCLIFRRGFIKKTSQKREWTKVEIRHQRTSDVKFAYNEFDDEGNEKYCNDYIYNMVETMVPLGRFNPEKNKEGSAVGHESAKQQGRLLHLWAPKKLRRTGWVTIAES